MDRTNFTTPEREKGQHLGFEERCSIKTCKKLGLSLRKIGEVVNCSASTVLNELRRGTGLRNGNRGRFPEYSAKRGQNERHNRLLRRYIPKGISIDKYSAEQILSFADEMNALPRKQLGYCTPEELFEEFLNQVYSVIPFKEKAKEQVG